VAIDRTDVELMWARQRETMAPPEPEVRIVEQSGAWQHMVGWLKETREKHVRELTVRQNTLQYSQDYSHEGLAKLKASLDIAQAELLMIQAIEAKILAYHKEEGDS
jgi:hypothetical protein